MNIARRVFTYLSLLGIGLPTALVPRGQAALTMGRLRNGSVDTVVTDSVHCDRQLVETILSGGCPPFLVGQGPHRTCPCGFVPVRCVGVEPVHCVDCSLVQGAVGFVLCHNHSQRRVRCGSDRCIGEVMDVAGSKCVKRCVCSLEHQLVEPVGGVTPSAKMRMPHKVEDRNCCTSLYVRGQGDWCACTVGYVGVYDGSCFLLPPQVQGDQDGVLGSPLTCEMAGKYAFDAAGQCERGDKTACSMLANLCVFMNFNESSLPCRLYDGLISNATTSRYVPGLYYGRGDAVVPVASASATLGTAPSTLTFVIAQYDMNGTLLGRSSLLEEFNFCSSSLFRFADIFVIASNREIRCTAAWTSLHSNYSTNRFFELLLVNPSNASNLIPVPVVVDFTESDISPESARQLHAFGIASGGYRRRFYTYSSGCGVGGNSAGSALNDYRATIVRRVVFFFSVEGPSIRRRLRTPVVLLQLTSKLFDNMSSFKVSPSGALLTRSVAVLFASVDDPADSFIIRAVIATSVFCFGTAWVRTYSWMRRRQSMMLDVGGVIRFLVYLCDHCGNAFALIASLASWYIFFVYKFQDSSAMFAVRERYRYLELMVYIASVMKGVAVVYAVVEQCNADYFVIDWERSKGQLLRENRVLPVSMWRSTFVANELNKLQTLRQWHPPLTMVMVLFLLMGLDYMGYAEGAPIKVERDAMGVYYIITLRNAVVTLAWTIVFLVVHIFEYQFYYRFVRVHPLQSFVDLCSVSNISILILPEAQWGYYIHGESVHAHSDVSMEEFQKNLSFEAQGNLPVRGLGGRASAKPSKCL